MTNDFQFIAGPVAYWPARIHDVALLDLYCPHVTSGRLAVCTVKTVLFLARLQLSRQPNFVDNNRDTVLLMEKN